MSENKTINKSSLAVIYEWVCPNCHAKHSAFGYEPSGKAGLYCVSCHVDIDVIDK